MFNEQPSYLGGMTTVMQDSMNGVQYGRENVNDGRYVPNQGAQGTVYREKPKMKESNQTVSPIQPLVEKYTKGFEPVEFHKLKVPSSLVQWKPTPKEWLQSLDKYEFGLQSGVEPKQLLQGEASFGPIVLEIIQPGTWGLDAPTQITRVQKLKQHFMEQLDIPQFVNHENTTRREEELNRNNAPMPNAAQNNLNQVHSQQAPVHNQQAPVHNQQNQEVLYANLPHNQVANHNQVVNTNETPWYMTGKGLIGIAIVGAIGWSWYQKRDL